MSIVSTHDRYRGAMLGLACGDAVGTTLEFKAPGSFEPLTDMVGGGPFNLKPGEWTDDTSMALCLADSLIRRRRFDARDQMIQYRQWRDRGHMSVRGRCFDCGGTVSAALSRFRQTGEPFAGSTEPNSAGNGSLMRLAPVPLYYAKRPEDAVKYSGLSSMTTHGCEECVDACKFFGGLIVGALYGVSKNELLESNFYNFGQLSPKVAEVAAGTYKYDPKEFDIRGKGYVVDCLEAALWAFWSTDNFRSCVLAAANLGDDADTTAAVAGQLAGAYYGTDEEFGGIPMSWLQTVAWYGLIEWQADRLFELSGMK